MRVSTINWILFLISLLLGEEVINVMVNLLDSDIVVSKFEFQSYYNIHFLINILRKDIKPPYLPCYVLNGTTIVFHG